MPDLTTAQRLAAYRDELLAEGFQRSEAWALVETAAPSLHEDLRVKADVETSAVHGKLAHVFGTNFTPDRIAEDLRFAMGQGS